MAHFEGHAQYIFACQRVQSSKMNGTDETDLQKLQDVVTEERVLAMLRSDKGNEAQLISWKIRDFTQSDNNDTTFLTTLDIKYSNEGNIQNTCYIVRLKPCNQSDLSDDLLHLNTSDEDGLRVDFMPETSKSVLFSLDEAEKIHIPRPHDYILQEHVEIVLAEDKGENARLLSWEIVDIAPKGDTLTCYVTTVNVSYSLNGSTHQTSYFVKVNYPLQKDIKDFAQLMFLKEFDFFVSLVPDLNSELHDAGKSYLRVPNCFYTSKLKGKEVMYMEDLRNRSFRKSNKKRGFNSGHTILVMEEIARLHASSVLLQKRYPESDLTTKYKLLSVDFPNLQSHHKDYVSNILTWGIESSLVLLRNAGGHEKAVDWITRHKASVMDVMEDMVQRTSTFDVLCHGNCWNNNILFRYDSNGEPVDVMLLDFQRSRMASLATDLNYFLLMSLNGDTRQHGTETFLEKYFEEFHEVLQSAEVPMPFTFQELRLEYKRKRLFGLFFAMGVHPFVVQECTTVPDLEYSPSASENLHENSIDQSDVPNLDSECSLRSRFLTIFTELEREGVFDHTYKTNVILSVGVAKGVESLLSFLIMAANSKKSSDPRNLITKTHIQLALEADKGKDAKLISWNTVDFTKKGDNFISYVTSVRVKYFLNNAEQHVIYVVKLNPLRDFEAFEEFTTKMFVKEIDFYRNFLPELNSVLESLKLPPLRLPKCFHATKEPGKELIILEDLRSSGFTMAKRQKGLDYRHVLLVIKELARLHASSVFLQKKYAKQDLTERHPFLRLEWSSSASKESKQFNMIMAKSNENIISMLNHIGGYQKAVNWITKHKNRFVDIVQDMIKRAPPFDVVCHGDIWNNNILFRYDTRGSPAEVMLIDLQGSRLASLGTDLNHFLFTSLNGDVRQPNIQAFLTAYMDSFQEVLELGGIKMPFSFKDLQQEFKNRHLYGLIYAKIVLPTVVLESNETPEVEEVFGQTKKNEEEDTKQRFMQNLEENPLMRPRFLAVFDEMEQAGVFEAML
ncbi:hypothetical protein SK128_022979 [Halocaridina rubra]|uniref:CHK kinase-like domain-containing protein n=1 Tax=Halocaridina rubra TaxID=373956 RepID=A0AAN8XRD1_HALRR